jgi:ribosome-binding ATPase YchF (GTP1/OBG family)
VCQNIGTLSDNETRTLEPLAMKILLMGDPNPNVGKSVIFSLAGIEVIFANYPGTIVEYTEGRMNLAARGSCVLMGAVSAAGGSHQSLTIYNCSGSYYY